MNSGKEKNMRCQTPSLAQQGYLEAKGNTTYRASNSLQIITLQSQYANVMGGQTKPLARKKAVQ
jgi:hypothetical protein